MELFQIRLLLDFGLVVLVWIVQLVIYPSFKYYEKTNLLKWHERYTTQITLVVFPLMFGQLIIGGLQLWQEISWYTVSSAVIISALWISTMFLFVPLHGRITTGDYKEETLEKLVVLELG